MKKPLLLMILDGFGYSEEVKGNAILAANTPNLDYIFANCPTTLIGASGMNVGLPDGQMGNSEVGHTNIGAGRIVYQELTRITKSIQDGDFFKNEELVAAMENAANNNKALHLMGLLSDGGVHSHITHLYALLEMAKRYGIKKVYVHAILDGRDTPPESGKGYVEQLVAKMKEIGVGEIATVAGRYYTMDRDKNWDRVFHSYSAMVDGVADRYCSDPVEAVANSYAEGKTDEFMLPCICVKGAEISEGDSFIFYNFRTDRPREITRTIVDPEFNGFERKKGYFPTTFITMTTYDATMPNVRVAFKPQSLENTLGQYISDLGMTQLRIAETEKYAHVTFFFNGGREEPYKGEDRVCIPSPKEVATYDLKPEMSAYLVTDEIIKRIKSGVYDVIILNFANCDMVGHTGVWDAVIKAVETVDTCVGKVTEAVTEMGGVTVLSADHGNADKMLDDDGVTPFTAHTTNPVRFSIIGRECELREGGVLADIAPTMLEILGLPQPKEMTGKSIIKK